MLTIYLPTLLILIIVYTTNFFKDFFFEAVVTVNLTSLLVLTTLFISVAQSLPPTAYVKMIDVWLIFAQIVPFMEVLLYSWIEIHRSDEDREINHHGFAINVEDHHAPITMVEPYVIEKEDKDNIATRQEYEMANIQKKKRDYRMVKLGHLMGKLYRCTDGWLYKATMDQK